jgi:hypothetical protein
MVLVVGGVLAVGSCSGGASGARSDGGADSASSGISLPDTQACRTGGGPSAPSGGADPLCTPDLPSVSYAKDVVPILSSCGGEICHVPWQYQTLVGQRSTACCDHRWLVEPGQPSASHVIQAVRGIGACVSQMPLDEGSLPSAEIATLVAWVCQGALDN